MLFLFKSRYFRRALWTMLSVFILLNVIAFFHAWKFTHFSDSSGEKTGKPSGLSFSEKLKALAFGISLPKPVAKTMPVVSFETIRLQSNKQIECWFLKTQRAKGTVILFHGFAGEKSSMLSRAYFFQSLGYSCLLVDFMGSGNSEGKQTTIGFFEAEEVISSYKYVKENGEQNIYLFGTSMGAAAIMKALQNNEIKPKGILLECPFGTMYKSTCARFRAMKVPTFPMAGLLVFWGGVQNGFWAYGHNPEEYAAKINCPVLLMSGDQDQSVSLEEIDRIYQQLKGKKKRKILKGAGHENYLNRYKDDWEREVSGFINEMDE